jgi:hypothetical protein
MKTFDGTAIEKINFMFSKMLELFYANPSMVSVIFSEEIFKNEEILKIRIVEILNLHASTMESIILDGQKKKDIRNDIEVEILALMIMGSLRLLVKRWDLNNRNFNLSKEGIKLVTGLSKIIECPE